MLSVGYNYNTRK